MDYQPMVPTFETKPFKEMNKKEALQYFDWYINEIPGRIEFLQNYFEQSGGGKKEQLDFSLESLKTIWSWFLSQVKIEKKSKEEIQLELEKYPKWLEDEVLKSKRKLSIISLAIADDISLYFAEVIIKNMKNIKWGIMSKPKSFISVNKPLLIWFLNKTPMDPRHIVGVLCSEIMDGEKKPNALLGVFNYWKQYEVE